MEAVPTLVVDAYKVGGIAGVLLLAIGVIVWFGWKQSAAREQRMSDALDKCQANHVNMAATTATALANNTTAMNANTEATKALCDVMRERPCLKDQSPASGTRLPHL